MRKLLFIAVVMLRTGTNLFHGLYVTQMITFILLLKRKSLLPSLPLLSSPYYACIVFGFFCILAYILYFA